MNALIISINIMLTVDDVVHSLTCCFLNFLKGSGRAFAAGGDIVALHRLINKGENQNIDNFCIGYVFKMILDFFR